MEHVVIGGTKYVPVKDIAHVEPYVRGSDSEIRSDRNFNARVVLVTGRSHLTEMKPQDFVKDHGFRLLSKDNVAVNPAIDFSVEAFVRTKNSTDPKEPYLTSLKWRAPDGTGRFKLLLEEPTTVLAELHGESSSDPGRKKSPKRPSRRGPRARDETPTPTD